MDDNHKHMGQQSIDIEYSTQYSSNSTSIKNISHINEALTVNIAMLTDPQVMKKD